jgi:hypothetical protein
MTEDITKIDKFVAQNMSSHVDILSFQFSVLKLLQGLFLPNLLKQSEVQGSCPSDEVYDLDDTFENCADIQLYCLCC